MAVETLLTTGVVKGGVVVPDVSLPEGARVGIIELTAQHDPMVVADVHVEAILKRRGGKPLNGSSVPLINEAREETAESTQAAPSPGGLNAGWKSIECSETNVQRVGWETFRRELPRLLQEHPGKWIAFHGEGQVALAASKREVYQQLKRDGCPLEEVVVRRIELLGPQVVDLRRPRRVLGPSDRREA
ncbi:hypothetical protein HYR99_23110 [Candidatus Poribacteria bacterium]|nr:hypothetical protein [Candidatus Poribacteria bacterium]